jgi:hypothetical protein
LDARFERVEPFTMQQPLSRHDLNFHLRGVCDENVRIAACWVTAKKLFDRLPMDA